MTGDREAILNEALQIVTSDRNKSYGEPEANQGRIAALWSTFLGIEITPRQACLMMALTKIAREAHGPKRDNLIDLAGYAAIADEL
jgi:hypothetical protein